MMINTDQITSAVKFPFNNLAQTRVMTQSLFSTDNPNQLAPGVTDYWIDYVHQQVQSLPNSYAIEKRELNTQVNQAKRLSKSQNVLRSGSFTGEGWQLGRKVFISSGDSQYAGQQLVLPPSSLVYPSYAYQTVPESVLKPYTRYYLSVFVLQADSLQIMASRYGNEVNQVVNVAYSTSLPTSVEGVNSSPNFFQYPIDVGALHPEANIGITVGFTVPSNGFAKISQVSLTEGRPLTAAEIRKAQNQEEQWLQPYLAQQAQITAGLQQATNQLNAMYDSSNWSGTIGPNVSYTDIENLTALQNSAPQEGSMPGIPMQDRYAQQKAAIYQAALRAWNQLQARNIVQNGLFLQQAQNWNIAGTVSFPQDSNRKPVLTLSNWDSTVTQIITLPSEGGNTEYRVRVRAKGQGTISIVPPGNQRHMLFFTQPTFMTQEFYFYPDANTSQVDLIIQSEGAEFTVDWVEVQEMIYEEITPHSVSGGDTVINTIGVATPLAQPGASIMATDSSLGAQTNVSANNANCQCGQPSNNMKSPCQCK
ncbi:hypothetical protein [Bacillus sp. SRB3LM]|uniref:hypothetical protein n=1 Tax=Bacillus sp. SRB3LM TaxID=2608689 RepID=UPI0018C41E64|nr:hypothetical protein [Bacillus sp. SRB3LM]MBG0968789.1 hypothetical protein [Bacillus sp. SRB3LM]MBG0969105.1 hypothetical protein [Bacillus sp. SRB3LM]MBG0970348.1 hypothetical protein [Bacillus sp. SRB3LM]MBG0972722.1 hypothetical protein [Bacillus sp. SRB3LM]MBG0972909.1 hypothetical protein [Bacillus sp. SRB3LM]